MDSKVKIFIAEDDPLMIRMYERVFRLSGYEVNLATDGEEALTKLKAIESPPTLVLLDIMMPKMNGFDVLKEMKQDEKLKKVPVVILTNLAGQADAEKALSLGAVLYLVKSQYDPKEVVEKVKEIIAGYTRGENVPEVKVTGKELSEEKG
ncbi:MAG: response regulator [Patescibacteria group bacterium]